MTTRQMVKTAFERCLKAVNPRLAVREALPHLNLSDSSKIIVISFGKASIQMALGAHDHLNSSRIQKTLILAPESQRTSSLPFDIRFGAADNLPDENSLEATRHLIQEIRKADSPSTVFLFLISGGGSALLTAPRPPVTLKEKLEVIKRMQAKGATIQELNTVRQKLSDVKGGKLLRNIQKGQSISLIISDVIGNPINLIASGPTVIPKHGISAKEVLSNLGIQNLPESVDKVLNEREDPISGNPINRIISSNSDALSSISESLKDSGFHVATVTSSLSGNAAEIGKQFAEIINSEDIRNHSILKGAELQYPAAFVFGGETTVILGKNPGKGGRNQEMVLSCLSSLIPSPPHRFVFLSAGTDGQDGPTDVAGAIISSEDPPASSPSEFLKNSDSYSFWSQYNGGRSHLKTGPSGTNVMDIQILVLEKRE
uniref:Glycerate kinase n=1 Tax=Caenorhabditis tropicalis TaxID=1561998 RepID=A0A1I7UP45_9PELO